MQTAHFIVDPLLLLTVPIIGDHYSHNSHSLTTLIHKFYAQFITFNPTKISNMTFLYFLLAIQLAIAVYQHHSNSSIQCPDVVSFCPFKPPTTTFCLHFIIKSSISIPPALPPFRLFILLLLAGDINPNPGPLRHPKVTYTNIRSIHNKYPAIAKFISDNDIDLFAMSEIWIRPDTTSANLSEITPSGYNLYQQPQEVAEEDWPFLSKMDWNLPLHHLFKISLHKESFYFVKIYTTILQYHILFLNSFSHFWRIFIIPWKIW